MTDNVVRTDFPQAHRTKRTAIGERSRPLRFLIAALVVAAWWALGRLLHADVSGYTLLGVPIMLAFQLWIHRQPLLALWVRSAPPMCIDAWFILLWILFSLVPAYGILMAVRQADWGSAATSFAAIIGAFGLAYALRATRSADNRPSALYFLIAVVIGLLPLIPTLVLPHLFHMRINGQTATVVRLPGLFTVLQVGLGRFLIGPVGFVVEEVFFRGALDTYLHRGEQGIGWVSAIYVSALWGLWHLSGEALISGHLVSTVLSLLVAQIILGVPLSFLWRKSGNLAVPDTTHAVLEAVRSILAIAA